MATEDGLGAMTQIDLFNPEPAAIGPSEDDLNSKSDVRFPPNPLDGLVHLLKDVTTDRGARIIVVKCGARMPKFRTRDRLAGAVSWNSEVTCPACKAPPCPPEKACPTCSIQTTDNPS